MPCVKGTARIRKYRKKESKSIYPNITGWDKDHISNAGSESDTYSKYLPSWYYIKDMSQQVAILDVFQLFKNNEKWWVASLEFTGEKQKV